MFNCGKYQCDVTEGGVTELSDLVRYTLKKKKKELGMDIFG